MPPKRLAPAKAPSGASKRKRMTIREKVKLLDMIKEGQSYASVARNYGINESTVRYIKKEEASIRKTASITLNKEAKRVVTPRNNRIVKMEAELAVWIADCRKKTVSLDTNMVKAKAKALYDQILPEEAKEGSEEPQARSDSHGFSASNGWFAKFQKRFGIRNVPVCSEAVFTDSNDAHEEEKFAIKEEGYLPEHDGMDDTGLFRKRKPSRTFLLKDKMKRPGFKAHKADIKGNAGGSKLKPDVISIAKNSSEEENLEEDEDGTEKNGLTVENLQQLCNMGRELRQFARDIDDNMNRAIWFSNQVEGALYVYTRMLKEKIKQRKQPPITMFFSKVKPPALVEESSSEPESF